MYKQLSLSLSMYISLSIYIYIYIHTYIHTFTYTSSEDANAPQVSLDASKVRQGGRYGHANLLYRSDFNG